MGLDSIVFYGTSAAAQTALAPTSAVIKGNSGDAYIVGILAASGTDTMVTLTCPGDPRWEGTGFRYTGDVDWATTSIAQDISVRWLPVKIPIKCGATLVCTQVGADDAMTIVYVDYPQFGEPFKPRAPAVGQPAAFLTSRSYTAGAGLTAFVISQNNANSTNFQRGKSYTPIMIGGCSSAMTTIPFIGLQNTKYNLLTFWPAASTPFLNGSTDNKMMLPQGIGTVDGGETQFVSMVSLTADTPVIDVIYAYQ